MSAEVTPLDNPIWSALTTGQQPLSRSQGLARRYPAEMSPLVGLAAPTPTAFADLAALVEPGERAALFTVDPPDVPAGWEVSRAMWMDQMVFVGDVAPATTTPVLELGPADVPHMLVLTKATEPGPFLPGTIRMARYVGVRSPDGRLVAMAGERLRLDGFTEVSAVCTDPTVRGQGLGGAVVGAVVARIRRERRTPFLHVRTDNGAKVLYGKLGFVIRRAMRLTVIGRCE